MSDTLNALQAANRSSSVLQAIANPPQVNPLAAMSAGVSAAGNVMDLRQKQAQQAAGEAYQGAINPQTGEFDPNKFRTLLSQSGPAAMAAGAALANTQQISSDQLNQSRAKAAWANSAAGSLTRLGPNITQQDAINALHDGLIQGILTPAEYQRQVAQLPSDAAGLHAWASQHQFTAMTVQQQLEQSAGTTTLEDVGGARKPVTTVPAQPGGAPATTSVGGGGVTLGLSPAQLAAPHDWTGADGTPQHGTVGEFLKTLGVPPQPGGQQVGAAPATRPAGQPAAAPPPPPPGASVRPPAVSTSTTLRGPGSPATPPPPAIAPQPGRSIPGPEPGMQAKWDASATQYNAANADAANYQARIFPLVQAASILKSGDVVTGQGAEAVNRVKSFLMTQATNLGLDAQTIQQADFDKVAKYLQQYVNSQGLSSRSDQALASAISGNPSAHISTLANQQILPAMLGMERMKQMIITDFKTQGGKPKDFSDYAADWQNKHDPRAFIFDQMDDPQRLKMLSGMTKEQRKMYSDTLDIVERNPGIMGQAVMPGH